MGGAPQKRRHKNKVSVAHLPMRHRIKVSVAHVFLGAPQKRVRHRIGFQCATEIACIILDFVLPAIHMQFIHSNTDTQYRYTGYIQQHSDII
jgi:hypothetical protein